MSPDPSLYNAFVAETLHLTQKLCLTKASHLSAYIVLQCNNVKKMNAMGTPSGSATKFILNHEAKMDEICTSIRITTNILHIVMMFLACEAKKKK